MLDFGFWILDTERSRWCSLALGDSVQNPKIPAVTTYVTWGNIRSNARIEFDSE